MADSAYVRVAAVLKREWWLVALAAAVAVTVAVVPAARQAPAATATAVVSVDSSSPGRARGVLLPDDLVRKSTSEEFRAAVASRAGMSAADLSGAFRVAASGSPITVVTVTSTMPSKDAAEKIARAVAEELVATHLAAVRSQIDMREERIRIAQDALQRIDAAAGGKLAPQDVFERWSIEAALIDNADALEALRNVYQYDGSVSSSVTSSRTRVLRSGLGGLVLGLLAGALLVAAREHLLARRAA
ncbi:MAG: hypothetical protein QMD96_02475 [Anaerosomatales bacterium]|nr:hypothetical protein [Anaerosomatales bacterium]